MSTLQSQSTASQINLLEEMPDDGAAGVVLVHQDFDLLRYIQREDFSVLV
jgi:hypothetical protein